MGANKNQFTRKEPEMEAVLYLSFTLNRVNLTLLPTAVFHGIASCVALFIVPNQTDQSRKIIISL